MSRNVFISFLGNGFYRKAIYDKKSKRFESTKTRFIQKATLEYIEANKWSDSDKAYFLLTEGERGALKKNWDKSIKDRLDFKSKKNEPYKGLEQILIDMQFPFKCEGIRVKDGKNEDELWDIFNTLYDLIEPEDNLYIDITHGFRSLPMLLLVFCNYVKFLKNVEVKSITYGNWEGRDENDKAPIIDLLPLSALQDWTFAAADYIQNGRVDTLKNLSQNKLSPILRLTKGQDKEVSALNSFVKSLSKVIDERLTCRGINIIQSSAVKRMKYFLRKSNTDLITPMRPIIEKIQESEFNFNENENIFNGFAAVEWFCKNKLYQQAATLLQENIVTLICQNVGLDWKKEKYREPVYKSFNIKQHNTERSEWHELLPKSWKEEDFYDYVDRILEDRKFLSLCDDYDKLRTIRNDFNHAGMKNTAMGSNHLISKFLNVKENIFKRLNSPQITCEQKPLVIINLSNHPSSDWNNEQISAAGGEIIDVPFPAIDPNYDDEEIDSLVSKYFDIIMSYKDKYENIIVHIMGEMTFLFKLVTLLKSKDIQCIASTTDRIVKEIGPNKKEVKFKFIRYRQY